MLSRPISPDHAPSAVGSSTLRRQEGTCALERLGVRVSAGSALAGPAEGKPLSAWKAEAHQRTQAELAAIVAAACPGSAAAAAAFAAAARGVGARGSPREAAAQAPRTATFGAKATTAGPLRVGERPRRCYGAFRGATDFGRHSHGQLLARLHMGPEELPVRPAASCVLAPCEKAHRSLGLPVDERYMMPIGKRQRGGGDGCDALAPSGARWRLTRAQPRGSLSLAGGAHGRSVVWCEA
eukprot:TRINITY_DN56701_c0_g1_i1.p1 TRINITY_DN56701_c0_g1~~TRINITY_DN56701_c0_g1_i1.p1  ORF type:complete len:239 (-),score=41.46 TRINITY_DN56701_c0_g1_i1:98-814(-)